MGTLKILLFIIISLIDLSHASNVGCYSESVRRRHFSVSPGDYSPELMTSLACMASCGSFDYQYAAITSGKICYCADTLPPGATPVASSFCDIPCVGDTQQTCGGKTHVSVYASTKKISGLTISSDASSIIEVNTPVSFDVGVSSGNDVIYSLDYDDGAGRTPPNVTDLLSRTFYIPGEYSVVVYANDVNQTFQDQVAATTVRVDAPPGEVLVECDPVFATYEEGICTCTLWSGSSARIDVSVNTVSLNFNIEDPPLSLAGPALDTKVHQAGDDAAATYVMGAAEFSVTGKIIGWEMVVEAVGTGTITMLILEPQCSSGSYCYSQNTCSGPCDSPSARATSCLASEQFCAQSALCHSTCTPGPSRYSSGADSYRVTDVVTVSVSATGHQYVAQTGEILVKPGYILGLKHETSNVLLRRQSASVDDDVSFSPPSVTVGSTFSISSGSGTSIRHSIRAVASAGSKVHLPLTFQTAGNFTLTATVTGQTLSGATPSQDTTMVMVLEGVNATVVTGPQFAKTGESVTFQVEPHTGNNVFYNWTFSDGTEDLASRDQAKTHVFATKGTYEVNVTTYNVVSSKSNITEIIVQDAVTGLAVTVNPTVKGQATDFQFVLAGGSNYTCTWNYGDGNSPGATDESTTPASGIPVDHQYTYATVGAYPVTVTCANDVSSESVSLVADVQEAITNLRMSSEGANKNQNFYLEWEVDTGTNITFTLTFDGNPVTTHNALSTYQWQSDLQTGRPASAVPLTLKAENLVSNETISISFKILTVIVNPTFTTDVVNASSHQPITFTADMTDGSDVTIVVNFGDGTSDTYNQPSNVDWTTPATFTKTYVNGGIFTVVATFSNAEGSYTRDVVVSVLVSVDIIMCDLPEYALYHPPAYANLTLVAASLPTDPVLTLNWGEPQSVDLEPQLVLNTSYPHTFGDTGTFNVKAKIENLLGSTTCDKTITIVEKLNGPAFNQEFSHAAKDLPFDVTFCLYRGPSGPICNLTFDFGDGSPPQVYQRQAVTTETGLSQGMDGCDTKSVTYTDKTPKTVTVTATTPLETVTDTYAVTVIDGVVDADVVASVNGPVQLGTQSQFTLTYNGAVMPTAAKVEFEFGDGSTSRDAGPHSFTITTASGSQNFPHAFVTDGLFETKMMVKNAATSVERIIQVGVFQAFSNLEVDVFYIADIPPNTQTNGLKGASTLFPLNKPVHFKVSDDNNAFATAYQFTATEVGGSDLVTCTHSTPEFSVKFNISGTYNIDITAENPLHTAAINTETISFVQLVEGFTLTEAEAQVGINEVKALNMSFISVGTDTCVYVDFGDGMKRIYSDVLGTCNKPEFATVSNNEKYSLSGRTQIEHVYSVEGFMQVSAVAENSESEESLTLGFSITGLDCSKPTVNIHNRKNYFTNPTVYQRSEKIKVRGLSNIQCVASYENTKAWKIEEIDPDYDTVIGNVDMTGVETDKAELNLPSRFLPLGLYKIHYTMTMDGSYGSNQFMSTTFTYVLITKSDLIGIMVRGGVTEIIRGNLQTQTLNPTAFSLDPDVDPASPQGLTVTNWTCEIKGSDPPDSTGCAAAGFSTSGQTQTLNLGSMQLDTYRIQAYLEKDTRTASTGVFVEIINGSPPSATILPAPGTVYYQQSDSYKVLKSSRLALDCLCEDCTPSDDPSYQWTIYLYDYRWPDNWRPLGEADIAGRVFAKTSKQISIRSSLFDIFDSTLMRTECEITRNGNTGKVAANLEINVPPTPGTCTITPYNRSVTIEKAWRLSVDGWSDVDGIEEYQFFIRSDPNTVDKQITSVQTDKGAYTLDVSLSEGPDYNDYKQHLIVKVRDTLQALNEFDCGEIVVHPVPVSEIRALARDIKTNQLHELQRLFAEGDQKTCSERSTSIMSVLNSDKYAGQKLASNYAASMYGEIDKERPSFREEDPSVQNAIIEYEVESQRNDRATVRKSIIENMGTLETESVISVQQVTSFLAEATIYGDEIDQSSQERVMDMLENMTNFLTDPTNLENIPSEDIEVAMENGVAVLGGIMDAAGNNGFFGTLDELEAATGDEEWFEYDTSIESLGGEDDMAAAGSYEEAMKIHTARIHKHRQAKTAEKVRNKIISTMDKQAQSFNRYSVPGQTVELKSLKMKAVMEKTDVANLQGKQLTAPDSIGGVVLPNISFIPGGSADEPVVVAVYQSTNHPLKYSEKAQGIGATSNFISINLFKENNTKISVGALAEPIKVVIPRDANMEVPSYIQMNPIIPSWSNLMNIVVDVNRTQSSIHLDFQEIENRQFLLVVRKGKLANVAVDPADDDCDLLALVPESMTNNLDDENRYRFYLDNVMLGNFVGQVAIGIRELNATEYDMDISRGCASLPRYANGTDYFQGNFSLRQYVSQCLAISDTESDWKTDGCVVGKETDVLKTVCYCTHLTTFAGGWVVVPNTIDWSYVFANADFLDNPTIYITVIVTAVIYIIAAIYARYNDKKMAQQLGIAPLADNDPKDKYFYEIIVCTGMRRNAGTNSQVCFILSGEDDETDVRAFSDSKRKIFRRGQVDGFLMAVPRPLGYLNFMRVWHDNSGKGKFGSWYLNYIVVRDVQTDSKQVFVSNRWFAVEEDDGQVDRVIPVAGREQLADFSYQFGERSRKNLADGHLWFSVIARPPQSRFTCLQRVSCCLCLLYVTMLTNAMFYNTTPEDEKATNSFSIGPFSVSPEQIFIGVVSNLIVFPVNFLLIFLFRKSRPHHKRPSRIDRALKEVYDQNKQASINDVKPEVSSIFSVSKTPTLPKDPHRPDTSASRPGTAMTNTSTEELTGKKKKKKFELPWYFTIIAWTLLWFVTLGALAMVIFYGISFKDETCRKWISSMLISFFMSVFITQPIKVFLFAVILSIIIKNPGEEKEDEEEDEEIPHVDQDNELLHGDINAMGVTRPRKIGYKPPDPNQLERLRQRRLKEIQMWSIVREVIIYTFFLWILMVISYRQLGASNFLYKDTMHRVFIANNETNIDFHAIRNTDEFWVWAKSGLVNGLRAGSYYNDYPPLKLRAFINDKVSRILGYATLRQLRVKKANCEIPDKVEGLISQCNEKYEMLDQEEGTFKVGWEEMGPTDTLNDTRSEYTYTSASVLNGYPYWGILSVYSGGGYVVPLIGSKQELIDIMDRLHRDNWIDRYTRAVFVEFTVYNPQVNLFAISTILAEIHPSGGLVQSFRFEPAMLLPYMTSAMLFQLVCEVVYIFFTLFFIIRELRSLIKTRLQYFKSFWNLVEIGIIAMSIAAIVIFFYRLFVTDDLTEKFKETNGNGYVKFQYVGYWNEMFSYMIGFLVFFATLKFLKLLRFNKKICMLSATLRYSAKSLLHFSIIFLIVFLAFAQLFYLTFMHIDIDYSTFISSVVASILMMMGKFDIYSMIMAEPVLTQVFVLLFVITVTFIIVNMFISILNETFSVVREDINKQGNDYEIVDFMLNRFKRWTGIGSVPEETTNNRGGPAELNNLQGGPGQGPNSTDHVQDFPDRIERLLQSISSVYMDNDSLAQLYQKKPYDSSFMNKNLMRSGRSPSPGPGQLKKRKDSSDVVARVHTH